MAEHETIESLARTQFGLVTIEQNRGLITKGALRGRVERGALERFMPRVLCISGVHRTWSQFAMGVVLQLPAGSALSHRTAAYLWDLEGLDLKRDTRPRIIEATAFGSPKQINSCVIHRSRNPIPMATRHRLPVTTLPRTLVDLSDVLTPLNLEKALDSARRKHKTFDTEFTNFLDQHPNPGRQHLPALLDLFRQRTAPLDSSLEVDVLNALREEGFPMPTHGHSVYDELGRYVMKIDHAWVALKIALHDDSFAHHGNRAAFERDARQRTILDGLGWKNVVVTHRSVQERHWRDALHKHLTPQTSLHFGPPSRVR